MSEPPERHTGERRDADGRSDRAEEALRESEERFRILVDQAGDGFFLHDLEGGLRDVNRHACEMLGYDRAELLRMNVADFEVKVDLPTNRASWAELHPGQRRTLIGEHRRKDGTTYPVEVRIAGVLVGGERLVIALARDVTERVRAEQQEASLRQSLLEAQRMESIGRLAGGVAHDFNNLLTVLLSVTEAVRDDVVAGRAVELADVDEIRVAGRRAADLTRQLLAFARKQVIEPTVLDLNAVVRGAQTLLSRAVREDVRLELLLAHDLWVTRCDRGQLEQVLLNLVSNARDAMPRGGVIVLSTRNVPAHVGGWVALTISDSGEGLTPEAREHLFEPFYTTKGQGRGTGLGLATVYGIVRQSGGEILVESAPGRGTTFELRFPRHEGAQEAPERPPEPHAGDGGGESLLVVEDDAPVRAVTVRALRGAGYRVHEAGGGPQALELLARGVAPALLVTDVVMPDMNGRQVAEALRRQLPALRVLFVSGYTQEIIQRHGALEEGVEFLAKPFTPAELLEKVRGLLGREARV